MKINRYRKQFDARCPVNGKRIFYSLKLERDSFVAVETIDEVLQGIEEGFHEDIADQLLAMLGGTQTLTAHHHGVDIETVRS